MNGQSEYFISFQLTNSNSSTFIERADQKDLLVSNEPIEAQHNEWTNRKALPVSNEPIDITQHFLSEPIRRLSLFPMD